MSEKRERPNDASTEKSLDLPDLPAYQEGEDVKGGLYIGPITANPTPTPTPICSTQGMSTCQVYESQVDTFCPKTDKNC